MLTPMDGNVTAIQYDGETEMRANRSLRRNRSGAVLAASMLFFLTITVSGVALLSMSEIHRLDLVRSGMDVRLLIAAEAALETKRGQFVLTEGVQEDWTALLPTSGWNDIGAQFYVNGMTVKVQGMPVGSGGHPIARLRSIAYGANRTRAVEYTIRAASFADYALYFGANNNTNVDEYTKVLGPYYSLGNINLNNGAGIEFYSHVETSGKVTGIVDPLYNFKQGYLDYVPPITLPPATPSMSVLRNAANATGLHLYSNTTRIELTGTTFSRTYRFRTITGYTTLTEVLRPIPDNSVIFVDTGFPPRGCGFVQPLSTESSTRRVSA